MRNDIIHFSRNMSKRIRRSLITVIVLILLSLAAAFIFSQASPGDPLWGIGEELGIVTEYVIPDIQVPPEDFPNNTSTQVTSQELGDVPEYTGVSWVELNGNEPEFTAEEITTNTFENYSELDELGRCGVAYANICQELMPTEPRESISSVKPSGWQTYKYDFVDGKYLYNRCHLIGFQLAGENANKLNLITGTRYLNIEGMLPFENMVADYVKETDNHVLYRVTPIYEGDELVARGVQMEGYSVEDNGEGISFNVYAYNVQPGVTINYATGESAES